MLESGLKYCVNNKIYPLEIEGDSQIVVNVVKSGNIQNWKLERTLQSILENLKRIPEFKINHNFQETNQAVNFLANSGVKSKCEKEMIIHEVLDEDLVKIIRDDMACGQQNKKIGI